LFSLTQGYIAGNPLTDNQFDTDGKIPYFHGMGLVSDELYEVIHHLMKAKVIYRILSEYHSRFSKDNI
jgi:serine carboxypeptidase-like clade 1